MPTFDLTPQQWVHEQEILTLTSKYQAHIEDLERKLRQAAVCLKGMMMMQQAHSSPGPGPGPSPATTFETAEKSTETAAAVPVSNKVVEAIDVADDDEEEEQEEVTLVENNTLAACKLSPPSSLTKHAFLPEIEFEISRQKYQAHIDEMERRLARLEIERNHAFTGWRLASVKVQELQVGRH